MSLLSRREFLRVSGLTAAGTVLAACAQPAPAPGPTPEAPPAQVPATVAPLPEATPPQETVSRFREAPMLAESVAAGDLPPVDERLPENPYVAVDAESVGVYGGTIRRGFGGVSDAGGPFSMTNNGFIWYNLDGTVHPNIPESWEINDDASEWTWHLRRGARWSDGELFTSEDVTWYWDHYLLNPTLIPAPPERWSTGDPRVLSEAEAPDDYTVVMRFAHPNPLFAYKVVHDHCYFPAHYMAQFHPDFTDLDALTEAATAAEFASWDQLFADRNNWATNIERPTMSNWIPTNPISSELFVMERNPYLYQVDVEGQQLPYVDRVNHRLFETPDVLNLWVLNGEVDFQARHISTGDFTLFKESEAQGGYDVFLSRSEGHFAVQPNHAAKDARLREFFGDTNVRLALSYAANRDEINELVWDGLATPRQYSPLSVSPQYYPPLSYAHLDYDPDRANELLDEAGYTERDREGLRLFRDGSGEAIFFTIEGTAPAGSPDEDAIQMLVRYFADVGIRCAYAYSERSLYTQHFQANEIQMAAWGGDRTMVPITQPGIFLGTIVDRPWAGAWGLWRNDTSDPNGEEPPEGHWIRDIWNLWEECAVETDYERANAIFFRILDIWAEQLPMVGYLGEFPTLLIAKQGMQNYESSFLLHEWWFRFQTLYWDDPSQHV